MVSNDHVNLALQTKAPWLWRRSWRLLFRCRRRCRSFWWCRLVLFALLKGSAAIQKFDEVCRHSEPLQDATIFAFDVGTFVCTVSNLIFFALFSSQCHNDTKSASESPQQAVFCVNSDSYLTGKFWKINFTSCLNCTCPTWSGHWRWKPWQQVTPSLEANKNWLVVSTHLKNMLVKLKIFSK